jgi:hypothetical protein
MVASLPDRTAIPPLMVSSAFRLAGILIVYLADGFTNRLASSFGRNGRPLKPEKGNSKQSAETVFWTLFPAAFRNADEFLKLVCSYFVLI